MKPVRFDYKRPATIDEACGLLASDDNARILAGGQSLIPMLSMRLSRQSINKIGNALSGSGHLTKNAKANIKRIIKSVKPVLNENMP